MLLKDRMKEMVEKKIDFKIRGTKEELLYCIEELYKLGFKTTYYTTPQDIIINHPHITELYVYNSLGYSSFKIIKYNDSKDTGYFNNHRNTEIKISEYPIKEEWEPVNGEMIEVTGDNGGGWMERKFIGVNNDLFVCENYAHPQEYINWKYARKIEEPTILKLDPNKEYVIRWSK